MRIIAVSIGAVILAGCATTAGYEAVLKTWIGASSDHLVSSWGPPAREYNLTSGGKVLEYSRAGNVVLPGGTIYHPQTTYSTGTVSAVTSTGVTSQGTYGGTSTTYVPENLPPMVINLSCVTRFTTDAAGRITNWAWQGNACKATPPKQQTTAPSAPPILNYKKCTADQIRAGECG
jgi:hypothetical protein